MNSSIHITLNGAPRSKKNHQQIITIGGHPRLIQSKQYREYAAACMKQIPNSVKQQIDVQCQVKCVYFMPTRRRVDLLNLMAATLDILVEAKVLQDDNCTIVIGHDGSRVYYDKESPRAEIDIIPTARAIE